MKAQQNRKYDESTVHTLSALEHIRLRTGMYIGRIGDGTQYEDGIYILLKEVLDNAVDEFIMGHGKEVDLTITDGAVSVRDFGRGIPLGKLVDCVSRINTGAKYNDDVFQFSVGMNGVGMKAVNALSHKFTVRSHRDGRFAEARFVKGRLLSQDEGATTEKNGTFVHFAPDPEIFQNAAFLTPLIMRRLRFYVYLNPNLKIVYNGTTCVSQGGLLDLVHEECQFEKLYPPFHFRDNMLEVAFTHTHRFSEQYYSFVNGQFTADGGTHLSAFREGLLKAVNEFSKGSYDGDDVREGIVAAVSIRLKNPMFESQTKTKLGNTEIRSDLVGRVRDVVSDLLHRHPAAAEKLLSKIAETEKLRKELQNVKKMARERSKSCTIRVPQLKDCKVHFSRRKGSGKESSLFITEGQSAAGSLTSCRDCNTQAVFTLKGKPLNVCDLNRDALYKNTEIYNLMRALNIEEALDGLRYNRVVLATDADVDGLHIRNLMVTFFLRFFEPLVADGHLFILETPLFRVRDKNRTVYCYSDAERDEATKTFSRGVETTRFKGLGEISPGEFKAFIGKEMRLTPVSLSDASNIPEMLSFYMGRNTPVRRNYIMEHLRIENE